MSTPRPPGRAIFCTANQRVVPRRDRGDHPDGFVHHDAERVGRDRETVARRLGGPAGVVLENPRRFVDLTLRFGDRLPTSSDSSRASWSACARTSSAARASTRPRSSSGVPGHHPPLSKAARARLTAASTVVSSMSSTAAIGRAVAGSSTSISVIPAPALPVPQHVRCAPRLPCSRPPIDRSRIHRRAARGCRAAAPPDARRRAATA
jgi:hypothetical protein